MKADIVAKLEQLNLSPNEARVYGALAEIGQTSAGEIISRTVLHRSVVYTALERLIERKLVFKLEKKKIAHFQITDPQKIVEHARTQVEVATELAQSLKTMVNTKLPEITVYEGVESYREFWFSKYRALPKGSVDYVAGSVAGKWIDIFGITMANKLTKLRIERKLTWHMVLFDKNHFDIEMQKRYPALHTYRLIERKNLQLGNFNIFPDSVLLHSTTEPMLIEIKNPTLHAVFQNIFDILWETGKEA